MKMKTTTETVGYVAVDSGQLMICDPCYIESTWKADSEFVSIAKYKSKDGKAYAFYRSKKKPAGAMLSDVEEFFSSYDVALKSTGKTPNEHRHSGDWEEIDLAEYDSQVGEFSGAGASKTTLTKDRCGMLHFAKGHEGAGFACSTYGDGTYSVNVTKDENGMITKVEIVVSVLKSYQPRTEEGLK